MTEAKREAVRVWCDGWYDILFNVSCILPGAQRNMFCMVYVVKLPSRLGRRNVQNQIRGGRNPDVIITERMDYGCQTALP
jgi:hypothetical protein